MAKKTAPKGDGHKSETTLHQRGMTNLSPANPDGSMRCKGGSVNAEATRSETSRAAATLGPRVA